MKQDEMILNYSFTVLVDGISTSFAKVSNISGSVEVDSFVVGGHNETPHLMVKPRSNPDRLILEKGCKTSMGDLIFSRIGEGKRIENLMIICKRNGKACRVFSVSECIVVKREFSPLDALGKEVFVEKLEIAHTGLTQLVMPEAVPMI